MTYRSSALNHETCARSLAGRKFSTPPRQVRGDSGARASDRPSAKPNDAARCAGPPPRAHVRQGRHLTCGHIHTGLHQARARQVEPVKLSETGQLVRQATAAYLVKMTRTPPSLGTEGVLSQMPTYR